MSKKLFVDNGVLSKQGKNLIANFKSEVKNILHNMGVVDEGEIQAMHSALMSVVGQSTLDKMMEIKEKNLLAKALWLLSDDDFLRLLERKYGKNYTNLSLEDEEWERYTPIAKKRATSMLKHINETDFTTMKPYVKKSKGGIK